MRSLKSWRLIEAREHYIEYNFKAPRQFNVQKYVDEEGEESWEFEFKACEGEWSKCTTWTSDFDKIQEIFWSCDPDLIGLENWDEEFTEKE